MSCVINRRAREFCGYQWSWRDLRCWVSQQYPERGLYLLFQCVVTKTSYSYCMLYFQSRKLCWERSYDKNEVVIIIIWNFITFYHYQGPTPKYKSSLIFFVKNWTPNGLIVFLPREFCYSQHWRSWTYSRVTSKALVLTTISWRQQHLLFRHRMLFSLTAPIVYIYCCFHSFQTIFKDYIVLTNTSELCCLHWWGIYVTRASVPFLLILLAIQLCDVHFLLQILNGHSTWTASF